MGLDMFACTTRTKIEAVDFPEPADVEEIHYWRKHPNLHGWMEGLYRVKGGKQRDFNCTPLRLDADDIDNLEAAIKADALPPTTGFFFGVSKPDAMRHDLVFIGKARTAMKRGLFVFYHSWW